MGFRNQYRLGLFCPYSSGSCSTHKYFICVWNKTLPSKQKQRPTHNLKGLWLFLVARELLSRFSECRHTFSFLVYKEVRPVLITVLYCFGGVAGILVCFGWCGFLRLGVWEGFFVSWDYFFRFWRGGWLTGFCWFGFWGFSRGDFVCFCFVGLLLFFSA